MSRITRPLMSILLVGILAIATAVVALVPTSASASSTAASTGCAMRGHAYAARVRVGNLIRLGPVANLKMCTNRVDALRRVRTVGVDLPQIAHVGAATSRIRTREGALGKAHRITAQSHTARVVLLEQIRARAVIARATASTRPHHRLVGRTVILGLTLNGRQIPMHPKRDLTIALPGLGKIVFNHQVRTQHGDRVTIRVTALRLVLGAGNQLHLPAAVVVVGHTVASVRLPVHR